MRMWPIVTDVAWSEHVDYKTTEPVEVQYGVWTRVGRGNHVLGGEWKGQFWGKGRLQPIVKYRESPT